MELDGAGDWETLRFLRGKHQFFLASLDGCRPSVRSMYGNAGALPDSFKMLRHLSGSDWDEAVERLKDASERQTIMHLFACFERIIRTDGRIRGEQSACQFHFFFESAASSSSSFLGFGPWLQCWVSASLAAKQSSSARVLRGVLQLFKDERNKMMHSDLVIVPPLSFISRRLHFSLKEIRRLASDFPLQP